MHRQWPHGRILGNHETRDVLWKKYKTKGELVQAIEKYIDYYTNRRVQRNLCILTPQEYYEKQLFEAA